MTHPTTSGPIAAERDMVAHIINTGYIEQHTHLHIHTIAECLEQLAGMLTQPDATLRPSASGTLEMATGIQEPLALPKNLLEALQLLPHAVDAPVELRRRAYAAWLVTQHPSTPAPQDLAAREYYVPLAGRLSLQDLPLLTRRFTKRRWSGDGPQRQIERIPLADVTEAVSQHPAFVLLGPPGCGKSTVLRRLALETARALLTGQDSRLPLRINLATYTWPHDPLAFVRQHWNNEGLPGDLSSLVRAGEVALLVDGFNEMARLATESERQRRAHAWQSFLQTYFADLNNRSRAIIASRDQADYDQPLDLPRVEIDLLSDDQITAFLRVYLGEQAEGAMAALRRLGLLDHARNPYQLSVLAALYDPQGGDLPRNRGSLFAAYAVELLKREERANHPHWMRLEVQLAALSHLGYAMQAQSDSTILPRDRLLALLPQTVQLDRETVTLHRDDLVDLACRAGLLIPDATVALPDAYRFSHHLVQEHFAARHLLTRWQAGDAQVATRWHSPRTHREMPPAQVGEWDPLPPPPPTGWEQTTILAAGMTKQPDAFVRAVLAVNPALAGRCMSEGAAPVSAATGAAVQQGLLTDLGNQDLHRRTRLHAGRVLGAVGDPRFTPQSVHGVAVILPDLVPVPGGTATLGSARWPWDRQAVADERPRHQVQVAAFSLARFPVTNAEYTCFMQAGGYETERYWTPTGWQWRQGAVESSGPVEEILERRQYYLQHAGAIAQGLKEGRMTPDNADAWRTLTRLSDEEARQRVSQLYPTQPHDRPYH